VSDALTTSVVPPRAAFDGPTPVRRRQEIRVHCHHLVSHRHRHRPARSAVRRGVDVGRARTGAGDAFASTFVAALIKGNNIEGALQWAPINSMSVVQKVGAQAGLLSERELENFLRHSPDWYHPSRL